jgi:serine protease
LPTNKGSPDINQGHTDWRNTRSNHPIPNPQPTTHGAKMNRPFLLLILAAELIVTVVAIPTRAADEQAKPGFGLLPGESPALLMAASELAQGDTADWSVADLDAEAFWKAGFRGKGRRVCVADTGAQRDHPDLVGQIIDYKDYTNTVAADVNGHGTWCTGHIVAKANGSGMVGVAPEAKANVKKVLAGSQGQGQIAWIAKAIRDSADEGDDLASLSLGGAGFSQELQDATDYARSKGTMVIAAAGNDRQRGNQPNYPGANKNVIGVAAYDRNIVVAPFSNFGNYVYVAAGGVNTQGCWIGSSYTVISGTSMATPGIAGMAALWCEVVGDSIPKKDRPALFERHLRESCQDIAPAGRDTATGWGKTIGARLLALALSVRTTPTPPTPPVTGLNLTFADLTPAAQAKVRAAGFEDFNFALTPPKKPTSPTTPTSTPAYPAPPGDGWTWVGDSWTRPMPTTTLTPAPQTTRLPAWLQPRSCPNGVCPR